MVHSEKDRLDWHRLVEGSDYGSMRQCFWWSEPMERIGVRARGIGIWRGARLVAGAMFRSTPIPVLKGHVTECLSGPVAAEWRPEWAEEFLLRLDELTREHRSVEVAIHGCKHSDVHRDVGEGLSRLGRSVTLRPGASDAVLDLRGLSLDDVWRGMHELTRRNVKKGRRNGIEIRALASPSELKLAHAAWLATANRKGFGDVRPWEFLEPVVRRCVEAGLGVVLAGCKDGRVLAAIFVTFFGGEGSYVYGGFVDGAEKESPNHVLHLEAIRRCLARGLAAYNLGALTWNWRAQHAGVDRFKLGFGAVVVPQPHSIVWTRRPLLAKGIAWARRNPLGQSALAAVRRRLLRAG